MIVARRASSIEKLGFHSNCFCALPLLKILFCAVGNSEGTQETFLGECFVKLRILLRAFSKVIGIPQLALNMLKVEHLVITVLAQDLQDHHKILCHELYFWSVAQRSFLSKLFLVAGMKLDLLGSNLSYGPNIFPALNIITSNLAYSPKIEEAFRCT